MLNREGAWSKGEGVRDCSPKPLVVAVDVAVVVEVVGMGLLLLLLLLMLPLPLPLLLPLLLLLRGLASTVEDGGVGVCITLPDNEAVEVKDGLAPNDREGVGLGLGLALRVLVEVVLPLAPCDREAVCEADTVEEELGVAESVLAGVSLPVLLSVAVGVPVPLLVTLPLLLRLTLGVTEGDDPRESGAVDEALTVVLEVPDGVALLDSDVLAVLEGLAPRESDAVCEALRVEEVERDAEGVAAGNSEMLAPWMLLGAMALVPAPEALTHADAARLAFPPLG